MHVVDVAASRGPAQDEARFSTQTTGNARRLETSASPPPTGFTPSGARSTAAGGGGRVAPVGSCGAVAANQTHAIELLLSSGLINPIEDAGSRQMLSLDDVTRSIGTGCVPQVGYSMCACSTTSCHVCSRRVPIVQALYAIILPTDRSTAPAIICALQWPAQRSGLISGQHAHAFIYRTTFFADCCPLSMMTASASLSVSRAICHLVF